MVAFNQVGEANVAAQEVTGYSGEDVPLEAPSNFTLNQIIDERSAILSWNPVNPDSVQGTASGWTGASGRTDWNGLIAQGTFEATRSRRGRRRRARCGPGRW